MKSERKPRPERPKRLRNEYDYEIKSKPGGSFKYRVHVWHLSPDRRTLLTSSSYGEPAMTIIGAKWKARKIARAHSKAKNVAGRIRI